MPRTKSKAPTLEQRCSPNGEWTFRRLINGKRKTFYTGTSNYQEAVAFRDRSIASETVGAELITRKRQNALKVIRNLSEVVDGLEIPRLTFQEGFDYWLKRNPEQLDNSLRRQKHIRSNYAHFKAWCEQKKLRYMDEISNDISVDYALHLWNSTHIRGTTFNKKINLLSNVFRCVSVNHQLPNGDPFHPDIVRRKPKSDGSESTHMPLEPHMLDAVMKTVANYGQDYIDLFIVGASIGARLKDCCLLKWEHVDFKTGFIEFHPYKTMRKCAGSTARIPISANLMELLQRRMQDRVSSYVNPVIANEYNDKEVYKKCTKIFKEALGKETTQLSKEGLRRQRNGCIYGFHSFRTTLMSWLATRDCPMRDAMRIFCWESVEMIKLYTKMLEKARGDMDARCKKLFAVTEEINFEVPEEAKKIQPLRPTPEALSRLVNQYSNRTIGLIYNISDVAVKKWMDKFGVLRSKRVCNKIVEEDEIQKIREKLQAA